MYKNLSLSLILLDMKNTSATYVVDSHGGAFDTFALLGRPTYHIQSAFIHQCVLYTHQIRERVKYMPWKMYKEC